MTVSLRNNVVRFVLLGLVVFLASPKLAWAVDTFPAKPIKIVVPVAAGGAPDIVARLLADKLGPKLGQPIIVDDRPGAGERIGAEFVSRAEPDGYTLFVAPPGSLVLSPLLFSHLAYDPKAFAPVTVLTSGHLVLIASPTSKVTSLADLVERAKANPGKLSYASPGEGTPPHLTGEMLKMAARIDTTHVPYKGLAPALSDLMAGHVDIMFDNLGNSIEFIKAGKVKALGVADESHIPELPDLPSISATYPAVHSTSWFGMVAPPGTPAGLTARLSLAIAEVLHTPEMRERLKAMSLEPIGNSPGEMSKFLSDESSRWHTVVTAMGISPQ